MPKITILAESISNPAQASFLIHKLLGLSASEVRHNLDEGKPFAEIRLFGYDHDENAEKLRRIIGGSSRIGRLKYYELNEDDEFEMNEKFMVHERSPQTLLNILDSADRELERQEDMDE